MGHDAYEASQVLKLNLQIESIAVYDDNLLVGTKQGHLFMYSITFKLGDPKPDVQLLSYSKTFSKKPIQQIEVIPEYQLLICLSDNLISVHDLGAINFPLISTVQRTKGATLFCLDFKRYRTLTGETSITVWMCVVVKKRLQLFYLKNGTFLDLREDLQLPDQARALAWCQETICVGCRGDYFLYHLDSGTVEIQDLFPVGRTPEPSVIKLNDSSFALGKESQSIFINTKGKATYNYSVKWTETPIAIANDEPYLLTLLPDCLEIRTIEPCLYIQTIPIGKANLLVRCKQGYLFAASSTHVWLIHSVSLTKQIHLLLEEKQFQLALKLTNISDETPDQKSKNISQIQTLYAFDLFNNKKFHESMKEFIELGTDPYEVIKLFPELGPQGTSSENDLALKLQPRELEKGLLALIDFLTETRHKILAKDMRPSGSGQNNNLNHSRTQTQLQIIDTTLLKCYLQTNDALVAPLLRLNHCHPGETEEMLKKHHKYSELIIMYQTRGNHRKALQLLRKQSQDPDSPLIGFERTLQYLQHLGHEYIDLIFEFGSWILEQQLEEGLKIFIEDIQEVEQLPRSKVLDFLLKNHKILVIPYLEHVVHIWKETNPIFHNVLIHEYKEKAQQMLLDDSTKEEGKLIRHKLLTFLESSKHFVPEMVLVHFPYDCLFEERAIILGNLGRHDQALAIYVSVLGDIDRAIKYCDKVYNSKKVDSQDVYVTLMKMLLSPPPENYILGSNKPPAIALPDVEAALSILDQHANKINPVNVINVLPNNVPLIRLKHFLEISIHNQLKERRSNQILKGLLYAEHLQVQEMRIKYESQNVLMTEFNVCPVCKKRFGNQSAFARYPNGEIVHYSCQERKN